MRSFSTFTYNYVLPSSAQKYTRHSLSLKKMTNYILI